MATGGVEEIARVPIRWYLGEFSRLIQLRTLHGGLAIDIKNQHFNLRVHPREKVYEGAVQGAMQTE
jgi:hypothetical protein